MRVPTPLIVVAACAVIGVALVAAMVWFVWQPGVLGVLGAAFLYLGFAPDPARRGRRR